MTFEKEKIVKAGEIINKMANGIDPTNGKPIDADCFLQDPRIIRCLFFVQQVLNAASDRLVDKGDKKSLAFVITLEEKSKVIFPEQNIGVSQFAKCINEVIDLNRSKKLTGFLINSQLKKMGILAEESMDDGKKRTVPNGESHKYGILTEKRNRNGVEYDMVCFNDTGKKFLLDELERILEYEAKD